MKQLFHGSYEKISEITDNGIFGGIFGSDSMDAALSHGDFLHVIESPRPLTDYVLNYELEGAWEIALEIADYDDIVAESIMSKACPCDDGVCGEIGWDLQKMRGKLATRMGYTSIEMLDEHGITCLCLPGCSIKVYVDKVVDK